MSKYKILWIDDKWEELISFKEVCELSVNGLEVETAANAEDGMRLFEAKLEDWSGVVVDAKLPKDKNSLDKLDGLTYCLDRINKLSSKREVPHYIFTGQPDTASGTAFAEQYEGRYYEKDKDEDKLIADIKNNADKLPETQIIHKHQEVFDNWPESKHELLRILKVIEEEDWQNNSVLNDIRKVMDDVMIRLYNCGYCIVEHTGSNLGECSKMLGSGYMRDFIPVFIQRSIHTCVDVTNTGSHRMDTDSFVKFGKAPYLLRGLIYDMLNVLHWCIDLPGKEDRESMLKRVMEAKEAAELKQKMKNTNK